jgi:hypothetical protein
MSALGWCVLTSVALVGVLGISHASSARDLLVVGGAAGFVFQALLGAWSFLLPSTRPPDPQRRRAELVAMELGGKAQVVAYNVGLVLVLIGLRTGADVSLAGITLTWCAAVWAIAKTWSFPLLARLRSVGELSERWWAPPEST